MKMNVGELVEALKKYPQDARILVQGYEGGFSDIVIKKTLVKLDVNKEDWNGPHDDVNGADTPAVVLIREQQNG